MFFALCQLQPSKLPYKSPNPLHQNSDLFFFCDPPHLLKTARNCFSNSFAHSKSRKLMVCMYVSIRHNTFVTFIHRVHNLQKNGQYISWKWIEHLYLTETSTECPGIRLCHKLTRDHVWLTSYTRMRVHLAAQVGSQCNIVMQSY